VAGHRQLHAAAQCEPLDARDHRLAQPLDRAHQPLPRLRERLRLHRRQTAHLGDIGTGSKGFFTHAAEYHHAHAVVLRRLREGQCQLVECGAVQCIELVGAIDLDDKHAVAAGGEQVEVSHAGVPARAKPGS
jgi:hypothetical protein